MAVGFSKEILDEIESIEIKEEGDFEIDIDKGLYVGAGVTLVSQNESDLFTVKPIFINWKDLAGHVSVYGTTRVGKTRLMVSLIRQCILRGMDIILIEPKGATSAEINEKGETVNAGHETIAWVMQFAEEAGRLSDIRYISPKFHEMSLKFNPLYGMSNEEISSLVSTIIPSDDEFFTAMGGQITMAVLLGLDFLESIEGEESINKAIQKEYNTYYSSGRNIINKEYNLSDPDLIDRLSDPDSGNSMFNTRPPYRSLITFADLSLYATQEGVIQILQHVKAVTRDLYHSNSPEVVSKLDRKKMEAIKSLEEIANKDKQFFSKVSSSFTIVMQQLSTGDIGRILCSTKINPIIDRWYSDDGQIIIVQPWPLIYKEVSKSFVRIFFSVLSAYFGNVGASGRAVKREKCLFVDEGGAVLYAGVEDLFNKAGGLGLRIFIFTQSFADYSSGLGEDIAKVVNDNTNIKIYLRMNDQSSREMVVDSMSTIKVAGSKYMNSKLDIRISSENVETNIMTSAHLGDMKNQEFLLQFGEGRFYCLAPFQPDPEILISMPMIQMEEAFTKYSKNGELS